MPDDQLLLATGFVNHRRTVTGFPGAQRAPKLLAREFVKSDGHALFSAHEANQFLAVNERVAGKTPHGRFHGKIFFEFTRPENFPGLRFETKQIPLRAQRVKPAVVNKRRGAWSGWIVHVIGAIVFVTPKNLAILFSQAEHALCAGKGCSLGSVTR